MLELGNDIVVTSTNGYKVMLDKAVIDIRAHQLVTDQPVQVESSTGQLRANSMKILESGGLVRFDGVTMTITNPPTGEKK